MMQTHSPRRPYAALYLALALVAWLGTGCAPSGPNALLQGEELVRKGNYEAAITKLKIATDLLRNDARAWNYLGLAYHGAGQYGEAIISYQRAQQLDQDLAAARYNLGELYLEQGNPVSAADELSIFTALQPKSLAGWVRLGDALRQLAAVPTTIQFHQLDEQTAKGEFPVTRMSISLHGFQEAARFFGCFKTGRFRIDKFSSKIF